MATTRTFLQNASTRHAIFVNRFIGSQLKEILPFIERIQRETIAKIKNKNLTELSRFRLNALLVDLDGKLEAIHKKLGDKFTKNMVEFADYEADFSARMFTKGTNVDFVTPSSRTIQAAVFTAPIVLTDKTLTIETALRQFSKRKRRELVNVIKDGVVSGKTDADIIADITHTTTKIQRNHAASLVRTITNQVSSVARDATMMENRDLVKGYEWVSTLDGRTSSTCQSLDGRKFPMTSTVKPPIHWSCRSTIIPTVRKKYSVKDKVSSERPSVGSDGPSTVHGNTRYNSWLKRQGNEFQDEVLGPAKGKLFREGGLPVTKFVDRNYSPYTLEQLKRKEPAAFKKAGLDDE